MFFHINKSKCINSVIKHKRKILISFEKFNLKTQLKTNKLTNKTKIKIIIIIKKWKKREAKYTLNNEVCIYAVGLFGLALLNLLQISQKQVKHVFSWWDYYCFYEKVS